MINEAGASTMQSLNVLLFFVLWRNELHVRLTHSRANRLGIVAIILLMLHEGLHILRRDNSDRVPKFFELTLPVKCA